jgi:3D-(3,5/4)-trihydroxycyclohexane-1,2-dione acylhydrolase (decyclizing)
VVLALPQDVQVEEFDFPEAMFRPRLHRVPRARPDVVDLAAAAQILRSSRRPLVISGGGVRYSGAAAGLLDFATAHGAAVAETAAGRTALPDPHPLNAGPLGTIGSASANALAADADVVLAVGTRLQDFTTSSWSLFSPDVRLVTINAARFDAVKHAGHAVVGDARDCLAELDDALAGWRADPDWTARVSVERARWDAHVDELRVGVGSDGMLSYAQVVGVVNDASGPEDYVLGSSGGIPGELNGGWRTGSAAAGPTMDLEYGFSCMGYEIAGPWGAAMARAHTHPDGLVTALLGDGSYLMLNSELFSAAFAGHPFVAVICDNGGYAVIHRLQTGQGGAGFNNLFVDSAGPGAEPGGVRVDFAAHAAALGCAVVDVPPGATVDDLRAGYTEARGLATSQRRPAVVVCRVSPTAWTESGAWWEVGVPAALSGRAGYDEAKLRQLRWTR